MRFKIQRTRGYRVFGRNKPIRICLGAPRQHRVLQVHRSDSFVKGRLNMELDKAFEFAVILAWEDLMKTTKPCTVRVEYRCEPGTSLDYLSVWSVRAAGDQYLVCDYWTRTSSAHPSGVRFRNGHYSDKLAETLDFIMKNQDQFTRRADACRDGLVQIYRPTGDERIEAATWTREVHNTAANFSVVADERTPISMPSTASQTHASVSL